MVAESNFAELFEDKKEEILSFFEQAAVVSNKFKKVGIPSTYLRKKIEGGRDEVLNGEFIVGVIGRFRIGKSTFLNVLLGDRILKEEEAGGGCTAVVTKIKFGEKSSARIFYYNSEEIYDSLISAFREIEILPDIYQVVIDDVPVQKRLDLKDFRDANRNILLKRRKRIKEGITKQKKLIDFALYILDHWEEFKTFVGKVEDISMLRYAELSTNRAKAPFIKEIYITVKSGNITLPSNVILMDTPGLGAPNWDENITIKHLRDCHAAIHMLLPPAGFEDIDLNLLTELKEKQPHILDKTIFLLNRSDEISTGAKKDIKKHVVEELNRIGFSNQPVLFACSKLPFLVEVEDKGTALLPDEEKYIDFTSYRFQLKKESKNLKKEVMDACGFNEIRESINQLLEKGRAKAILQQATGNLWEICEEIEKIVSSQKAMVENGTGKCALLNQMDELFTLIDYKKGKVDKEIFHATYQLRKEVFVWLAPYKVTHTKDWWSDIIKYMEDPGLRKKRRKKEIVANDLKITFLGSSFKISGFKEKIESAAQEVVDYIEDFWSWDNYIKRCNNKQKNNACKEKKEGIKIAEEELEKHLNSMKEEFITALSSMLEKKLNSILDEVKTDISNIYQAALEKISADMMGLSEELISKLNKILNTSFEPIEIDQFATRIEELDDAQTHLKDLGKANGAWENILTAIYTVFASSYQEKVNKNEAMRLGRIQKGLIEHLERNIFLPLTDQIIDYITRVVKGLQNVMMIEVEMQLEDIKAYALVDKFGSSQEQLKLNIEAAVKRKYEIEKIEFMYRMNLQKIKHFRPSN